MDNLNLNFEIFMQDFSEEMFILGNHHNCGIFKETYEERGNKLLRNSNLFLNQYGEVLTNSQKCEIKCQQHWIVGFLSGQNYKIYNGNEVSYIF